MSCTSVRRRVPCRHGTHRLTDRTRHRASTCPSTSCGSSSAPPRAGGSGWSTTRRSRWSRGPSARCTDDGVRRAVRVDRRRRTARRSRSSGARSDRRRPVDRHDPHRRRRARPRVLHVTEQWLVASACADCPLRADAALRWDLRACLLCLGAHACRVPRVSAAARGDAARHAVRRARRPHPSALLVRLVQQGPATATVLAEPTSRSPGRRW